MSKAKTANDWLAVLSSASSYQAEDIPEGFKTSAQLCEEFGLGKTAIKTRLRILLEQGKVEKKDFRAETGKGKIPHYRLK